jgi:hypothetical protein
LWIFALPVTQKSRLSGLREPKGRRTFGLWRAPGATWSLQEKNRLIGDFSGFYAQSATNSWWIT